MAKMGQSNHPQKKTNALENFLDSYDRAADLNVTIARLNLEAIDALETHFKKHGMLTKTKKGDYQFPTKKIAGLFSTLQEYDLQYPVLEEMFFVHFVNMFLTYLSDVLLEVYLKQPKPLCSKRTLTYEEILSYDDIESLAEAIARKVVADIQYKSFTELAKHFDSELKVKICTDASEKRAVIRAIETRNILVHNRGIVNEKFLAKVRYSSFGLGERIQIGGDSLVKFSKLFVKIAYSVDSQIVKKFFVD